MNGHARAGAATIEIDGTLAVSTAALALDWWEDNDDQAGCDDGLVHVVSK